MANDKKTIGITRANATALMDLVKAGRFSSELDAAKFAMAYAIQQGVGAGAAPDGAETKWNVGSVDPDGMLRPLLEALFPGNTEPYRLAEHLMNEGITQLAPIVSAGGDLHEMIFPA